VLAFSPGSGGAAGKTHLSMGGIYGKVYAAMTQFEKDPYPGVSLLAKTVMEHIRVRARELLRSNGPSEFENQNCPHLTSRMCLAWFL